MLDWLRLKLIVKLGGYTDIDSLIESISSIEERNALLTRAVKKLFNTLGPEDILREDEHGRWILAGKVMSNEEKQLLISEANQFQDSFLWKILQIDVKYQANKGIFLKAVNEAQITAGKLWLLTLDTFKQRIKNMVAGKAKFSTKEKKS